MKTHERLLFALTFVFGLFCGVMLYVLVYAPAYQQSTVTDITQVSFQLTGQMYGACSRGTMVCPSFVLKSDRRYRYLPWYSQSADTPTPVTGRLSVTAFNSVVAALRNAPYDALAKTSNTCVSSTGGTDYQYGVVIDGTQHTLDTCHTVFGTSPLSRTLAALWAQVTTTTTTTATTSVTISQQDIFNTMKNWIHENFAVTPN